MFKVVKALMLGTAALPTTGIVHFAPEREGENRRYGGGIFPDADAAVLVRKGLGQVVGEASEADYKRWQAELAIGTDVNQAAADRIGTSSEDSATVDNVLAVAFPLDSPARVPSAGLVDERDPDAAPGAGDDDDSSDELDEPSILDQSIPKLTEALLSIDDVEQLRALRDAEEGGKSRGGALEVIDARIAELEGPAQE